MLDGTILARDRIKTGGREDENRSRTRTILRTRGGMEIYRNPKSVLPRPLKGTEDVLPAGAGQEGLVFPHVDRPPRDGESDPI